MRCQDHRTRLHFDILENRITPAGNMLAKVVGGNLVVKGDSLDNDFIIQLGDTGAGSVRLSGNNGTQINGLPFVQFTGISKNVKINLAAGNNTLRMDGGTTGLTLPGSLSVKAGLGADVIRLARITVSGGTVLNPGGGDDQIFVDDCSLGSVASALGAGNDAFAIETDPDWSGGTTISGGLSIKGAAGNDGFNLGSAGNSVTLNGSVVLNGGGQLDALNASIANQYANPPGFVKIEIIENESLSTGQVSLAGVSETAFNPLSGHLDFLITGASFATDPTAIIVSLNGVAVSDDILTLAASAIGMDYAFTDGANDLQLLALDAQGNVLERNARLWAGSYELTVTVYDENDVLFDGAVVTASLGDDQEVTAQGVTVAGQVVFPNLPDRTIFVQALASNNRFAATATTGSAGTLTLTLLDINPASPIDNNDFSQGTDGWDIGTAPVTIIPHDDSANRSANDDLQLGTSGEGPQSISRSFTIKPGAKNVTVKYRFITSEVPGGYFGTKWNDFFNVTIRSEQGGGNITEGNSMNGLGLGAFEFATGATAWKELTLPVNMDGDTVQVDLKVANVGDDKYDSQIVVDIVKEKKLDISQLQLNDIDDVALQYISVSSNHTYFDGNTRVHGTITIKGDKDDELQSLELQLIQGGSVVATATLASAASNTLVKSFGTAEELKIDTSQLLFELSTAQAGGVNVTQNDTITLRVKAVSKNGEEALKEFGAVQLLTRYTNANRYGGRDVARGGDDWVKPDVKTIMEHFSGLTWGDMSNMNAGSFAPDHASHDNGQHADGWFTGYNERNAATAQTMIDYLNDATYGSNITTVYVTYQAVDGNAFYDAIKDVTLNDGRAATAVIQVWPGHDTHFHWVITP